MKKKKEPFGNRKSWNNHHDRSSFCLRQQIGHVDYISWKIHQFYSRWEHHTNNVGFPTNGRKQLTTLAKDGTSFHCTSELCVSTVVLGVIVDTSPRSDADAASGDRPPTASGDQWQDITDWLQSFTEGLIQGIWTILQFSQKHVVHIPARPSKQIFMETQFIHTLSERPQL